MTDVGPPGHPPREPGRYRHDRERRAERRSRDAEPCPEDEPGGQDDVEKRAAGPEHHRGERVSDPGVRPARDHVEELESQRRGGDDEVGDAVSERVSLAADERDQRLGERHQRDDDRRDEHRRDQQRLLDDERGPVGFVAAVVL